MKLAAKPALADRVSVVVATRNRESQLAHTLGEIAALPDPPPVIVVDNASDDGTVERVRAGFPDVTVVALTTNRGSVARNIGVMRAATPYVAFSDDDSWWSPGALERAADVMDDHPEVSLVAARVLVGPEQSIDPVSREMARSPLPLPAAVPGRAVLGFLACGAIVRRHAFLQAGGFDDLVFFLGEEELLAYDLASRGHLLVYLDDVVAHHHPIAPRDVRGRRTRQARNHVVTAILRRPWRVVVRRSAPVVRASLHEPWATDALREITRALPIALRRRQRLPDDVERLVHVLESASA